jgi:radical SAM superfamily enzyme YgiQ (UPF0313 family)
MKMKFAFINPGFSTAWTHTVTAPASWPPLGLVYIATLLKSKNFEVVLLDHAAAQISIEEVVKWVEKEDPDALGFSTLSSSGKTAALIAEKVKEKNPDIKIVFGNYHATFNARRILETYPFVDVVVRGEGEITCLELAEAFEKGSELNNVRGIVFRKEGKVIFTSDRPLIKNLDALPFPDRSLLKKEYKSSIVTIDFATEKFTTVVSSRGCPYRCRFCACSAFAQGIWRPRSAENIAQELELLNSQGYKQFLFVDDNFALNPKRVLKLCDIIRKNKIDAEWIYDARVDGVSLEVLRETVKAGCKVLFFGIESANQRILNYYNKGITPQQSLTAVKVARRAGIDVLVGSFVVGSPDETREEIMQTFNFAKKLDLDLPVFRVLELHPGTPLWLELASKGLLDETKYWETGVYSPEVCPSAVPIEEIYSMMVKAFKDFVLRPQYVLIEFFRLLKSRYRMRVATLNRSKFLSQGLNWSEICEVPELYRSRL